MSDSPAPPRPSVPASLRLEPRSLDDLRAGVDLQVRAVATDFLRQRPLIVLPFLAFTLAVLALFGAPAKQLAGLSCGATAAAVFFVHEWRIGKTKVVGGGTLLRSLVVTLLGIAIGATLTGALASPLLPMLAAPIGVGFAAFGRSRGSAVLFAVLAAVVAILFAVSPSLGAFVPGDTPRRIVLAAALLDAALLLRVGVTSLAAAHGRAADALVLAGDEIVRGALARTRALESLGVKVAHEVKNPLTAVRAVVELMHESGDERTKRRLTVAAGEIARIEQIITDYGSLAHPLDVVRRGPTDVTSLADRLVAVLDARAARAGVDLSLRGGGAPVAFDLDRDRIYEALLNLVLNALHATPAGGRVTLECKVVRGELELHVADTGRGMDATTLAKLGTPFFTLREGGTGLGVALARQVAEQHGGTLTFESRPGVGTTATMRVPRESNGSETKERDDAHDGDATHRPRL